MGIRAALSLLAPVLLGACASHVEAIGADQATAQRCEEIATTGDMFRECLIIGPEQTASALQAASSPTMEAAIPPR